jgi:pimeloyl-ACP methyl ester carboxylesterase
MNPAVSLLLLLTTLPALSAQPLVERTTRPTTRDSGATPRIAQPVPRMIVVGFTGGLEKKESKASGIVALRGLLERRSAAGDTILTLTYNNFHWRRAATQVREAAGAGSAERPTIVVYGHSWGAGAIGKFARRLKKDGLDVALAVYIDAFMWRNPRVPDNVRTAVNFYQRSGMLRGLPMRGKAHLIPDDPDNTYVIGSFQIDPKTEQWGWSWNLLQPLFYRHHHRIAHDLRLKQYLVETLNLR